MNSPAQNELKTFLGPLRDQSQGVLSPNLKAQRIRAIEALESQGLPGRKHENWKYSKLNFLLDLDFKSSNQAVDKGSLDELLKMAPSTSVRLTFVNGRFEKNLSILSNGVSVISKPNISNEGQDTLALLNTAFLVETNQIAVDPKTEIDICILNLASNDSQDIGFSTHNEFHIQAGSKVKIFEHNLAYHTRRYFSSIFNSFFIKEEATLSHLQLQQDSPQALIQKRNQVRLEKQAKYTSNIFEVGGHTSRNETEVTFTDSHSRAEIFGLFLGFNHQHKELFTRVFHDTPECTSRQLVKGILSGNAEGVFDGNIVVKKEARLTDAQQTNKNLVLSESAIVHSKPQLRILCDDVKCAHGATTGQLDSSALFYMRSRGLSESEAQQLLTKAFAQEIVDSINDESTRNIIQNSLNTWFQKNLIAPGGTAK